MYNYEYLFEKRGDSGREEFPQTTLKALFFFKKDEIINANADRGAMQERIDCDANHELLDYLEEKEKLKLYRHQRYFDMFIPVTEDSEAYRILILHSSIRSLRFGLTVKAHQKVELEKMLDLDALDKYILTGKMTEDGKI